MTHRNMLPQTPQTLVLDRVAAVVAIAITTGTGTTPLGVRTGVSS